ARAAEHRQHVARGRDGEARIVGHGRRCPFAGIAIIVACIAATSVSPRSSWALTSAAHTARVRPGRSTRARATNRRPAAGASRFTLNSTDSTSEPALINVDAAYPQALSAMAVTTAACR